MTAEHEKAKAVASAAVACATALASAVAQAELADTFAYGTLATGAAAVVAGTRTATAFPEPPLLELEDDGFAVDTFSQDRLYSTDGLIAGTDFLQNTPGSLSRTGDLKLASGIGDFGPTIAAQGSNGLSGRNVLFEPFNEDVALGELPSTPGTKFGFAVSGNAWATLSGLGAYRERPVFDEVEAIADCYATGSATSNCTTVVADTKYVDGGGTGIAQQGDLTSPAEVRGAYVTEVGLSFVREFGVEGNGYVLGLTPKYVIADVVDFTTDAEHVAGAVPPPGANGERYEHFNADFGIAGKFGDGWRTGLVVKNVLAQEYETARNGAVRLTPQARISIARPIDW